MKRYLLVFICLILSIGISYAVIPLRVMVDNSSENDVIAAVLKIYPKGNFKGTDKQWVQKVYTDRFIELIKNDIHLADLKEYEVDKTTLIETINIKHTNVTVTPE